eukprot:jgi/Mesvir1/7839/Mv25287-RA.1
MHLRFAMANLLLPLRFPAGLSPLLATRKARRHSRRLPMNCDGGRGGRGNSSGSGGGRRWNDGGEGGQSGPNVPFALCCVAGAWLARPSVAFARTHSTEKSKAPAHGRTASEPESAPTALSGINPVVVNLGVSGVAGFISAKFLKSIGRMIMMGLGLMLLLVQVMTYYGWISVNWAKVNEQFMQYMHVRGGVRQFNSLFERTTALLSTGLPSVAGFYAGFMAGIK